MNVYKYELKAAKHSTIIWTCVLAFVAVFYLAFFQVIRNDADTFLKITESVSPMIRQALGLAVNQITSPLGYYSFVFTYILFLGALQATNMGINILSKEVRDKTADFLLTKPKTRSEIITAKMLSSITLLFITNIVYVVASVLSLVFFTNENFNMNAAILISSSMFIVQLIFFSLGFLIAVIFPKIKSVISVSLPLVFCFFIISLVYGMTGDTLYRNLSIFKYFDPTYIIVNSMYETKYLIYSAVVVIVFMVFSYVIYRKKDVHAV